MNKLLFAVGSIITFLVTYYAAATLVSLGFIAYYLSHGYSRSGTALFNILSKDQSYNIVILAFLLLIAFYVLFYRLKKRKISELIEAYPSTPAAMVFSVLTGFSFYLVLRFYISFFLGDVPSFYINIGRAFYSQKSIMHSFTYIITVLIILPALEEAAHRGILFSILKRKLSLGWALFTQSMVYALMYSESYIILYTFVLGIIAGAVYYWHKSIVLPILIHLGFNTAALILSMAAINKLYDTYDSMIFIVSSLVLPLSLLLLFKLSTKIRRKPQISLVKKGSDINV